LIAKLNNERMLEVESQNDDKQADIREFLENSPFKIHDKPGTHEIMLTRDFGNEKCGPNADHVRKGD
jgi:complement component 1 Q subcomponent-binding protein, mitochondrial